MLRNIVLVLVVFLSLPWMAHAQTENVMVDDDWVAIKEFKLTVGSDIYSLNQVNGIKDPIYVGKDVEIAETLHIKKTTNEIILKTNLHNPTWYVDLNAHTGDTIKINTTGGKDIDIKLEGVLVPEIVNEKINLNYDKARIILNRDKMLINEKVLLFSCINSKGDVTVWMGIPVKHPEVVKVEEKLSECIGQGICSEYESSINTLMDYGLLDKANIVANDYKECLDAESEIYSQMYALEKQRYLFAGACLLIGLIIGFGIGFVIFKNKKGDKGPW